MVQTDCQGVYMNIIYPLADDQRTYYSRYVGSSWGKYGVQNRIKIHERAYKKMAREFYHYKLMVRLGKSPLCLRIHNLMY